MRVISGLMSPSGDLRLILGVIPRSVSLSTPDIKPHLTFCVVAQTERRIKNSKMSFNPRWL